MLKNAVPAVLLFLLLQAATAAQRRVAITIDDGPVVGEMENLANFESISAGLIGALQAEHVQATIFINERQLNVQGQRDARVAVLERWLGAGFDLGNHTYSHPSLNSVPLSRFGDDVVKGEVITRALVEARGGALVWFRYPYLHSGLTAEIHQAIVDFLEQRQYRILLLHCNELNSISLRESLARMRGRGYQFITLEEAMKDPVYQRPDTFAGPGGSWLSRTATTLGRKISATNARVPEWVSALARQP